MLSKKSKQLVEIYYETKCPFSLDFLNTSLRQAWEDKDFRKAIDVKLYPFGNAVFYPKKNVSRGYHYFHPQTAYPLLICQHGEVECLGNRIHACTIDVVKDSSVLVPFAICVASYGLNAGVELSAYECGKEMGIDMESVKKCVDSKDTVKLMRSFGESTQTMNVTHVPWVAVNGKHTVNDTVISPVCRKLHGSLPKVCRSVEHDDRMKGGGSGPCLLEKV